MFKSVFSKYITAFMVIIVVSFIVVSTVTFSVVGKHSAEAKRDYMKNCSEATRSYVLSMMHGADCDELEELIFLEKDNIIQTFDWMALNVDAATVLLLDKEDKVLLRAGDEDFKLSSGTLGDEVRDQLRSKDGYSHLGKDVGMLKNSRMTEILPVFNSQNEYIGAVAVCSGSLFPASVFSEAISVITSSVFWVLLAALIAVYFISERIISPLREISSAAKSFASGKFDVRVAVRGNDEIAELATTFNNMAQSLDNYDEMRNSFMSNVSHDLRSPMTSISGFIDGILDGVIPPEQHKYYLQIVSGEVKRLSRLVNSLLDLSRIQAGERKFIPVSFDICEMARQILISFEQKIDAKDLCVEFESFEDRINVIADHDAIYQVFYNVCDNAVKFASDGGKLSIFIKKGKGKKIAVEVFNEGQGIPPEEINFVFERFYKLDKSRGLNKNGTGLGLFISKTIIEAHEERIWVESEYGKNCCFGFSLSSE